MESKRAQAYTHASTHGSVRKGGLHCTRLRFIVVVGFDRYFNYHKIQTAQLCINENPGCMFIATNTDAVTHLTDAQEWAGNGSMVGCIKGCTNRSDAMCSPTFLRDFPILKMLTWLG